MFNRSSLLNGVPRILGNRLGLTWGIKSDGGVIEYMGKGTDHSTGGAKIGVCWEPSNYGE